MIKLGLGLLGLLAAAAPIGYKLYKDSENTKLVSSINLIDVVDGEKEITKLENVSEYHKSESPESPESPESTPIGNVVISETKESILSENQKKILDWANSNGGCKIKVYDEDSKKYEEVSKLKENFDLSGFLVVLTTNSDYWKGNCGLSNTSFGHREGSVDAIEGMYIKKQSSGRWELEEGED